MTLYTQEVPPPHLEAQLIEDLLLTIVKSDPVTADGMDTARRLLRHRPLRHHIRTRHIRTPHIRRQHPPFPQTHTTLRQTIDRKFIGLHLPGKIQQPGNTGDDLIGSSQKSS